MTRPARTRRPQSEEDLKRERRWMMVGTEISNAIRFRPLDFPLMLKLRERDPKPQDSG